MYAEVSEKMPKNMDRYC